MSGYIVMENNKNSQLFHMIYYNLFIRNKTGKIQSEIFYIKFFG